jgi:hypothetical protein
MRAWVCQCLLIPATTTALSFNEQWVLRCSSFVIRDHNGNSRLQTRGLNYGPPPRAGVGAVASLVAESGRHQRGRVGGVKLKLWMPGKVSGGMSRGCLGRCTQGEGKIIPQDLDQKFNGMDQFNNA